MKGVAPAASNPGRKVSRSEPCNSTAAGCPKQGDSPVWGVFLSGLTSFALSAVGIAWTPAWDCSGAAFPGGGVWSQKAHRLDVGGGELEHDPRRDVGAH